MRFRALCFNRTFMELKLRQIIFGTDKSVSFNRTFMELKYINESQKKRLFEVLIVPLWN